MPAKFIIYQTRSRQFYFTFESSAGEIILTSEPFVFRVSCLRMIEAVRLASAHDYKFQQGSAMDGQWFFVVRGTDHEVLATSGFYPTVQLLVAAKEVVRHEAGEAGLEEG